MTDRWMIRGTQYVNCNCASGCPCQFGSPTTHGFCEALGAGVIEEGYFNDTRLDGLNWAMLLHWPGEIARQLQLRPSSRLIHSSPLVVPK